MSEVAPKNRDKLIELEATLYNEAVKGSQLVSALKALAGHEIGWSHDNLTHKEQDERTADWHRGYVAANKKLIHRLTNEPAKK